MGPPTLRLFVLLAAAVIFSSVRATGDACGCCSAAKQSPTGLFPVLSTTYRELLPRSFQLGALEPTRNTEGGRPTPVYLSAPLHRVLFPPPQAVAPAEEDENAPSGTRFFLRKWFLGFVSGQAAGQYAPMYGRAEFQNFAMTESVVVWVKSGAFLPDWKDGLVRGGLQMGFVHIRRKREEEYEP